MAAEWISAEAVTIAKDADPAGVSITIPADATAVVAAFAGYTGGNDGFSSATLNGNSPAQVSEVNGVSGARAFTAVAVWFNTATGSQTLDVVWDAAITDGPCCIVAYAKGVGTTPRDMDSGNQESTNALSVTLTTETDDLVIKFDQKSTGVGTVPPPLTSGWTNGQTQTSADAVESMRCSYIAATGSTQACDCEDEYYSTIAAIALAPGGGGATIVNRESMRRGVARGVMRGV